MAKKTTQKGLAVLERLTPSQLTDFLMTLASPRIMLSTMIWGPPSIGKSSIVQQVAQNQEIDFIDLRLSQLAPANLRGLPVAENGQPRWYPPEFLPREGVACMVTRQEHLILGQSSASGWQRYQESNIKVFDARKQLWCW